MQIYFLFFPFFSSRLFNLRNVKPTMMHHEIYRDVINPPHLACHAQENGYLNNSELPLLHFIFRSSSHFFKCLIPFSDAETTFSSLGSRAPFLETFIVWIMPTLKNKNLRPKKKKKTLKMIKINRQPVKSAHVVKMAKFDFWFHCRTRNIDIFHRFYLYFYFNRY